MYRKRMEDKKIEMELMEQYKKYDINGDGFIDLADIKAVMKNRDEDISDDEIEEMIAKVDINGDGKIDYEEFVKMIVTENEDANVQNDYTADLPTDLPVEATYDSKDELMEEFKNYDMNGDGFVVSDEIRAVIKKMGIKMSDDEIEEMVATVDMNGDGQIEYEEFIKLMMN